MILTKLLGKTGMFSVARSTEVVTVESVVVPTEKVVVVIPAYNEEQTIGATLQSLLDQSRIPDEVHVIVNNTSDDTVYESSKFEGIHQMRKKMGLVQCEVIVHDIGRNFEKKVGALNYGYALAKKSGADYFIGVDGDTTLDKKCIENLLDEMVGDSRIGGLSAIYGFEDVKGGGPISQFLLAAQKSQFAAFNMDHLLRKRTMSVLGGQCSIFRMKALESVCDFYLQDSPWTSDSEVEDSLLSLQIKKVRYMTKISARARASVGPMLSLGALNAQQVKWAAGGANLLKEFPLHPNMRQKWSENIGMVLNILVRVLFGVMLSASLALGAFVFNPIWLIPPVLAWLLAVRVTASMENRTWKDWVYSVSFVGPEIYMWLKFVFFAKSWWQVLSGNESDNWGAQSRAESGGGGIGWLVWPVIVVGAVGSIAVYAWLQLGIVEQTAILGYGWPMLMLVTVALTLAMFRKALRPHRGFTV